MITIRPTDAQASQPSHTQSCTAETSVLLMDPRGRIEVAAGGSGPINDPPGADTNPPKV